MRYDPGKHHRRSIRLKEYDYSQAGAYSITICTQNRECLFGEIVNGEMRLNDAGLMVQSIWDEIPSHYSGTETDEFVIMPNHVHGIAVIVGAGPRACPLAQRACPLAQRACPLAQRACLDRARGGRGQPRGVAPTLSLPDVVHRFKTMTTKRYTDGVKQHGWTPFPGKLWQRNYYEHIIRNENDLNRIREYIVNNPPTWKSDRENPGVSILETTTVQNDGRS